MKTHMKPISLPRHAQGMSLIEVMVAVMVLAVGLLGVVAAISPYVYESPHHHCPFCILKREYAYFGFALYIPLFAGASAGLASGVLSLRPPASLQSMMPARTAQLRAWSMAGFALFSLLGALAVWQSGLRL